MHFLYLAPSLYSFCATLLHSCCFGTKSSLAPLINSLKTPVGVFILSAATGGTCLHAGTTLQLMLRSHLPQSPAVCGSQEGIVLCCTFNNQHCSQPGKGSPSQVQSLKTVSRLKLKELDVLTCMQGQILPKSRAERAWGDFSCSHSLAALLSISREDANLCLAFASAAKVLYSYTGPANSSAPLTTGNPFLVQLQPQAKALELKIVVLLGRPMKKNLVKFLSVLTNIRKYLNDKSLEEGSKRGIYNIFC